MDLSSEKKDKSFLIEIRNSLKRRLLTGLLVVVPLWLTYFALKFFFRTLDSFFAPLLKRFFGMSMPGLGFILLVAFIYLVGMITANIIGKSILQFGESLLNRIPFVKNIYQAAKQLVQTVSFSRSMGFKRVVLVEYPRKGLWAVGFVTNSIELEKEKKRFDVVFIPTTPNPTSGFIEMIPEGEAVEINLTIEEGLKMVISGGLVSPKQIATRSK